LSVGAVVVDWGVVVVVVVVVADPPPVEEEDEVAVVVVVVAAPLPDVPVLGAVVVVVGGATKGTVSPTMEAALLEGLGARLVQLRAWFQLANAVAAGVPVRGWGSPARIVAGRKVGAVMWRPTAVRSRAPLAVSGGVLS
jgi:hypothetical protein